MPIRYTCVGCREELILPDARAGQLCACPFCRLKFLAPPPGSVVRPPPVGSVAPRPSQLPPPPPPPLYPLAAARRTMDLDDVSEEEAASLFGQEEPAELPALFGQAEVEIGALFQAEAPEQEEAEPEAQPAPAARGSQAAPRRAVEEMEAIQERPTTRLGAVRPMPSAPPPATPASVAAAPPAPAALPTSTPAPALDDDFDLDLVPLEEDEEEETGTAAPSQPEVTWRLTAQEGLPKGTTFQLHPGKVYLIGRDKTAEIKILSTSVSRRQAQVDATGASPVLVDLGSANGTQVNGAPVQRHALVTGDLIKMGAVVFRYDE